MKIWYENFNEIKCNIERVSQSLGNYGDHYIGVTRLMPGLTSVELIDQGLDFVHIKTNEGLMKRTNITKHVDEGRIVVEFDEEYLADKAIQVQSHFMHEFKSIGSGIQHHMVIDRVKASGFLGFFYRNFGRSSIGNSMLKAYQSYLES